MKKVRVELPFEVAVLVGEVLSAVADKGEVDCELGEYGVTLAEVKGVAEKLRFASKLISQVVNSDPCPECGKDRSGMDLLVRNFHPGAC